MKFFLLATSQPSKHLMDAIKNAGHTYEHFYPNTLYLFVSESESGYDRLYNGSKLLDKPERISVKDFDAVITRLGGKLANNSVILQHLTENLGLYCAQNADSLLLASNKIKTTQKLSAAGLKVPKTIYAPEPTHADFLMRKIGGLPAIAKTLTGSQGIGVVLLNDAVQTNMTLQSFHKSEVDLLLQGYIEAGSKDIRAIVVGSEVVVAMERSGKDDIRANISRGGSGRKIELSTADKELCVKAAQACGLSFAGVDIMKDANGTSYVIEVNGNPGDKIIDITGHNYFNELVQYTAKKGKIQSSSSNQGSSANAETNSWYIMGFKEGKECKAERRFLNHTESTLAYQQGYEAGFKTTGIPDWED